MSNKSGVMMGGDAPGLTAAVVTPSDTTQLEPYSRALWVGGGGDLSVVMEGDNTNTTVTFVGVATGTWMPLRCKKVMAGTSASDIVAVF